MHIEISKSQTKYNNITGEMTGKDTTTSQRTISDIKGIFKDSIAAENLDQDRVAYKVNCHFEEKEGKEGGLFFGTSYVMPGKVGNEYFMTKGHFHSKKDTAEYYWCIGGNGCLILMDEDGNCTAEFMDKGSIHYIAGNIAHRIANISETEELVVGACWPSDAGHDYESIIKSGFTARLFEIEGKPTLIEEDK